MSCSSNRVFASPCHRLITPRSVPTSTLTIQLSPDDGLELSGLNGVDGEVEVLRAFPLTDLPSELIDHVFSFLDSAAPSDVKFNDHPTSTYTTAEDTPLKDLSRVSRRLRGIILPRLFANVRLDPYKLTPFLAFIHQHDLAKIVQTVVAQLQGPCNHLHPAWWARLLNEVSTQSFTIICAPHIFAELVNTSIVGAEAWAFNMPYQLLRFRQPRQTPESPQDHISLIDLPSLFSARKWTELSVNEGSSLKAYTTYEYFLRRTPSLLATLHSSRSTIADNLFANLESFNFTAIFPFYNHVDEILKSVRKMKNLKILRTKLCPEPDSTVLNDEIEAAGGHIDVNDPWNEFDTAYNLIAHSVLYLTLEGQLQELHIDDIKMEGIRENIESSITQRLQEWWCYRGDGVWVRQTSPAEPVA